MSRGVLSPSAATHAVARSPSIADCARTAGSGTRTLEAEARAAGAVGRSNRSRASPGRPVTVSRIGPVTAPTVTVRSRPCCSSPARARSGRQLIGTRTTQADRAPARALRTTLVGAPAPAGSTRVRATLRSTSARPGSTPVRSEVPSTSTRMRVVGTRSPSAVVPGTGARTTRLPTSVVTRRSTHPDSPGTDATVVSSSGARSEPARPSTDHHDPAASKPRGNHAVPVSPSTAFHGPAAGVGTTADASPLLLDDPVRTSAGSAATGPGRAGRTS